MGQEQIRWLTDINDRNKNVWCLLNCLMKTFKRNDGLPAYLVAMTVRLIEMHRVLKSTGSIYLHVDPTASHYLKLVMDQIFGGGNFQNEIIWSYKRWTATSTRCPGLHDVILFYAKTSKYTFKCPTIPNDNPNSSQYVSAKDENGKTIVKRDIHGNAIKRKLSETIQVGDVWELGIISPRSKERLGYPTRSQLICLNESSKPAPTKVMSFSIPTWALAQLLRLPKATPNWIGMDVTHHAVACTAARLAANLDLEESDIPVIGVPFDLESARHLRDADRTQYDAWAILNLKAAPHEEKSGRLIGIREFKDWRESRTVDGTAIYVTSNDEPPSVTDVDRLERLLKQNKADLGFLVAFTMPDEFTLTRIERLGEVRQNNGRHVIPKVQVITVEQIVEGGASATKIFDVSRQQRRKKILSGESQIALEV